jgi:hypothetical protein
MEAAVGMIAADGLQAPVVMADFSAASGIEAETAGIAAAPPATPPMYPPHDFEGDGISGPHTEPPRATPSLRADAPHRLYPCIPVGGSLLVRRCVGLPPDGAVPGEAASRADGAGAGCGCEGWPPHSGATADRPALRLVSSNASISSMRSRWARSSSIAAESGAGFDSLNSDAHMSSLPSRKSDAS